MAPPHDDAGARDALFDGPGEMRALLRATDWARTPLGPPERWSRSLRTLVGAVLGNRFPMLLWWGPRLLQLYNDAYRPILGGKHPAALAAPGPDVWAEIWHIIGPQADSILAGGPATWNEHLLLPMNRKGFLEETYFTFSYSPVPDDDERIGGVLVTCQETTEQVQDDRQLRTLRDLAAGAASARSEEEACERAARILAANDADVPFAALYVVDGEGDGDGRSARLVSLAGFGDEAAPGALPEVVPLESGPGGGTWPFAEARARGGPVVVEDLRPFGTLPRGRWERAPSEAVSLPLARPGAPHPYGFLVCGVSPLRPLDERYRGFFALVADQLATTLANVRSFAEEQRRRRALEELDRAKTAFFSNVSHELRTPLTLMLGPTEDALAAPEPALAGAALEAVHRNQLRLLKLVNSLLDFARIEAGRVEPVLERTDVASLTRDLAEGFRPAVERAGLHLVLDVHPGAEASLDREMYEKILLNLLSNALKFTLAGEIGVALRPRGEAIELVVSDTGAGIPPEEQARVFERFHRVEGTPARTVEGSGIGLALVSELARLHGGSVAVASAPGAGSRFTVTLPIHPARSAAAPPRAPSRAGASAAPFLEEALGWLGDRAPPAGAPAPPAEAERILVVEDNADLRAYLASTLGPHWRVEAVADGARALEAARAHPPDLVLTDVMMPGLDGFALLRALRAEERTKEVPVVMLSARAGEEARVEGLEAGADDYVVKPFGSRELVARLRAQLTLARTRRALDGQRAALYRLFEQAPTPICVLRGERLVFEMANSVYRGLVGRGPELLGKPLVEALPEIAGTRFVGLLLDVLRTREPYVGRETLIRLARGPAGALEDTFWTFTYAPYAGSAGEVERVMVFANDVTEQVLARRETEAASRAKDEFLAVLGHELRNPLSPMVTALQLMRLRAPGELARERAVLERQVGHMTRLVDDLLDVSRIAGGKVQLRKQPTDLADAAARAIEIAAPLLEERRHHLAVRVPRGLRVDADPDRLAQVLSNLLTNAAKYTPPGGNVTVAARREGDEAVIGVADDGQGIDPELLPRVFDLFVQGKRSPERTYGGLGLGLTIVRSLTELHGGRVEARSAGAGKGSEFLVRLPLLSEARRAPARASGADGARAAGRRRVLVVDDNRDAADTLAEALAQLGHETRCAYDGLEAIETAARFRPEVVLLDLGLPVLDGYEVARRLREDGTHGRLVALTGYGQDSDRRRSSDAGFDLHLVKPIQLDDLADVLR
jgi:signal transduction histidine kinase